MHNDEFNFFHGHDMIFIIFAYLIGSITFGVIIPKLLGHKDDIRAIGSGNVGATNVTRAFGKLPGLMVLVLDMLKGYAAVMMAPGPLRHFCAIAVVLGHIFPIYFKFRGGKAVATALGTLIVINIKLFFIIIAIWVISYIVFKRSYVSALISFSLLPIVTIMFFKHGFVVQAYDLRLSFILSVIVWVRHISNIKEALKCYSN